MPDVGNIVRLAFGYGVKAKGERMTREEAKRWIEVLASSAKIYNGKVRIDDDDIEALETAITALSNDPCEDAISRKELIEWLEKVTVTEGITFDTGFKQILTDIRQMPSVQPVSRWIPVSEKLPECGKNVLVTDSGGYVYVNVMAWDNEWLYEGKVVAWMPLPTPAKLENA